MGRTSTRAVVLGAITSGAMLVAMAGMFGGCAKKERPLYTVLESADRHALYARYPESLKDYSEYLSRRPDDVEARVRYGETLLKAGQAQEATYEFRLALDTRPGNQHYAELLAEAMYQAGSKDELMTFLRHRIEERGNAEDHSLLGIYAHKCGFNDEAEQALKTAARLDGGKSFVHEFNLSNFYGDINDRVSAIRHLRYAYAIAPKDPGVLKMMKVYNQVEGSTFGAVPEYN
ncbi:MAG: tetratricopeptide repeat protein [Phycisphaerales bacterium]